MKTATRLAPSEVYILRAVKSAGAIENLSVFSQLIGMDYSLCHRRIVRLERAGYLRVVRRGPFMPLLVSYQTVADRLVCYA